MQIFDGLPMIGGHPALDYVNSVEYRGRPEPGDRLTSFPHLVRWCLAAGILSSKDAAIAQKGAAADAAAAGRTLRRASALREAFLALLRMPASRSILASPEFRLVARRLEDARAHAQLQYKSRTREFSWIIPVRKPDDVLRRISASVGDFLVKQSGAVVRMCAGPNCDWMFIDRSHAKRRRWCQPAVCGNLVRVRRFRRPASRYGT